MIQNPGKALRFAVIILFIGITMALTIQSWVLPIAFVVIVSFLLLAIRKPKSAVLLILFAKPIIDATWEFRIPFVGLNFLQITGVAFPVIIFLIIYSHKAKFYDYKAINLFKIFVFLNLFSYLTSTVGSADSPAEGLFMAAKGSGVFFQFLNSFAAYLIIPFLFRSDEDRKHLFWALILAGIFPTVTGLLQIGGVITGRTLRTTGELIRISGFYHDSTNMRMYSLQTLLAIFVYLSIYLKQYEKYYLLKKSLMYFLIPLTLLIIYRGYSKAALGIILCWIILYFVMRRKFVLGSVVLTVLGAAYFLSDTVSNETEKLLYKEIRYAEGNLPEEFQYTLLGGRFVFWGYALDDFAKQDLASQLLGYNYISSSSSHNDFLRVLLANGIVGLIFYITMLLSMLVALLNSFIQNQDNLALGAILIFAAFIIDSIGLVPLIYPGYCWVTFGIISLSLNRNTFMKTVDYSKFDKTKPIASSTNVII